MTKDQKRMAQLHSLRSWCVTVIDYIVKVDNLSLPFMTDAKRTVDSTFERKSIKGLEIIKNDLRELFGDLSVSQREELSSILKTKVDDSATDPRAIAEVIYSKGCIESEDDYRFLSVHIDNLLDEGALEEVERVNELLIDYIKKIK